jgi:hypothetical protein
MPATTVATASTEMPAQRRRLIFQLKLFMILFLLFSLY